MTAVLLMLAAPVGVWGGWGAFRGGAPVRCYAIAEPMTAGGANGWKPFAGVTARASGGIRGQLQIRLSAVPQPGTAITLSVGERRFALVGRGSDAWAPDAAADRAVIAAIRDARSMSVAAVSVSGRPFADTYALNGAATAIDAAALACPGMD